MIIIYTLLIPMGKFLSAFNYFTLIILIYCVFYECIQVLRGSVRNDGHGQSINQSMNQRLISMWIFLPTPLQT